MGSESRAISTGEIELERIQHAHDRAQAIESVRRVGVGAMYSPAFFLVLMLGVMVNLVSLFAGGGRAGNGGAMLPGWANVVVGLLSFALMVSIPAMVMGMVIRLVAGRSMWRHAKAVSMESMPALPAPSAGEIMGMLAIKRLDAEGLVMRRRPAPAVVWIPFTWGVVAIFSTLTFAVVSSSYSSGGWTSALIAGGFMGVWWTIPLPLLRYERVTVRGANARTGEASSAEFLVGLHALLPKKRVRVSAENGAVVVLRSRSVGVLSPVGRGFWINGFAPGPLGQWQARRVAGAIGAILRHDSSAPIRAMEEAEKTSLDHEHDDGREPGDELAEDVRDEGDREGGAGGKGKLGA